MSVDVEALAGRVARLEAIEIAKVTAARYGRACDRKDVDALRNDVFTADAVLRLPTTEEHGIDAVAAFYAAAFASEARDVGSSHAEHDVGLRGLAARGDEDSDCREGNTVA